MITREDVLAVANSINQSLSDNEIDEVLKLYPSEEEQDPTATWDLIVEQCIHNVIETTPTFEVVLRFNDIDAKNPLDATKKILKWIQEGADAMIYEVQNELTHEKWTVDLSEEDEDAVLPNNE